MCIVAISPNQDTVTVTDCESKQTKSVATRMIKAACQSTRGSATAAAQRLGILRAKAVFKVYELFVVATFRPVEAAGGGGSRAEIKALPKYLYLQLVRFLSR